MNLTLNHWIRFVGLSATTAFVMGALRNAPAWHLAGFFAFALVGALIGHWLAVSSKGEGN